MQADFDKSFLDEIKSFKPHKGDKGNVCVIGGSFEYSGAPYYSAISALRTGVDLSFVICDKEAAPVIKSYSPELIVFGLLDGRNQANVELPTHIISRTTCFVVGPGLSRNERIFDQVRLILSNSRIAEIPIVFDGDGIEFFCKNYDMFKHCHLIITPNANELIRIEQQFNILQFPPNITLYCKNETDLLILEGIKHQQKVIAGTERRCGGQGDVLSGVISAIISMSDDVKNINRERIIYSLMFAGELVRRASFYAYGQRSRGMSALDVINNISSTFESMVKFYSGL